MGPIKIIVCSTEGTEQAFGSYKHIAWLSNLAKQNLPWLWLSSYSKSIVSLITSCDISPIKYPMKLVYPDFFGPLYRESVNWYGSTNLPCESSIHTLSRAFKGNKILFDAVVSFDPPMDKTLTSLSISVTLRKKLKISGLIWQIIWCLFPLKL